MRRHALRLILLIHLALIVGVIFRASFCATEPGLLAAGMTDWRTGQFSLFRVNPPLVRMWATLPLIGEETQLLVFPSDEPRFRGEWNASRALFQEAGIRTLDWLRIARCMNLVFPIIGILVAAAWATRLYGKAAGIGAALMWCFYPSMIGFGALISGDAQAAAMTITTLYFFRNWLDSCDWGSTIALGALVGLTVLTKFSLLVLFGLLPFLWLTIRFAENAFKLPDGRSIATQLVHGVVGLIFALIIVNSIYGFKGSLRPLDSYQFISKTLVGSSGWDEDTSLGNRFRGTAVGVVPVPFPEDMVRGIDLQKWDFDRERWSYFAGQWQTHGWWYYYFFGLAAKTPVGMLLLAIVAGMGAAWHRSWRANWRDEWILLFVFVAMLMAASLETGLNRHLRYVLPIIPLAFVLISRVFLVFEAEASLDVGDVSSTTWRRKGGLQLLVGCSTVAFIIASLGNYPFSLSYFNGLVGGAKQADQWFNASNIGWGQDLLEVRRWQHDNPRKRPVWLTNHYSLVDAEALGIESEGRVPSWTASPYERPLSGTGDRSRFPSGWYIVDRETLLNRDREYEHLRRMQPEERLGMNFLIYQVTEEKSAQLQRELGRQKNAPTQTNETEPVTTNSLK
ncbi:ArnT family glycosyltransferase [Rhodopirellula baltica]|uniref:Glycosyltransferase RgtA/B/C/D-like domain-containing protein n=1 Tax=Rhodopirellula baltica SWK14 TaxID=993516 RepID=L7C8M7_RHOBT|nr:glycosyltransferase family 39 protein [Rhodopirellula baltica]ELP30524.1 hypothetical protein RBSWK_05552 [Rhodopirellula baltica SWK14]